MEYPHRSCTKGGMGHYRLNCDKNGKLPKDLIFDLSGGFVRGNILMDEVDNLPRGGQYVFV